MNEFRPPRTPEEAQALRNQYIQRLQFLIRGNTTGLEDLGQQYRARLKNDSRSMDIVRERAHAYEKTTAYQQALTRSYEKAMRQFDVGRYYHDLAFSRSITHDAVHTQTHTIRYG
jgi:hypothetical protein